MTASHDAVTQTPVFSPAMPPADGPFRTSASPAPTLAPDASGWASTATAIHAVRRMPAQVLLRIEVVNVGSIVIDPRVDGYSGIPADELPVAPAAVYVETHPVESAPPVLGPLGDLDAVLWHIGELSFGDERATWLWPTDRYRLVRWPRITRLAVELDTIKMFAALGAAMITVEELADAADVPLARAQRTVNALSLMGLLTTATAAPPAPRADAPRVDAAHASEPSPDRRTAPGPALARHSGEKHSSHGLFSRLRKSLGL
ncbi:hypothetical protein [Salinibacterium sp. ZJ77]|uniref:hypothetical protein n=1 Tax=Salinibacterium sp. ZJ77 TaxID=2708337 RepID=UPI00141E79BE|nr:hypothetical protein [Salinibacterium sp. ZJ77]